VFIKQQALQKRIRLETKFAPDLTNAFVDERRIRQVLINLLSNAVKFTPKGGKITLTTSPLPQADDATEQPYLRIAVLDTGIGIAPENINKLFQPFVQIDGALNRQYAGTGLGLALVKQIVELHGGRVGLTSELGVGSCFTIDLPYEPETETILASNRMPPTGQDDIASTVSEAPLTAPLVLLAEDNEANISTISSYLTAKGYRIISAKNGEEAIAMAYAESPDLILMDIQMPEVDGLTAIRQLRHDPNFGNIPIIALTALAMASDRERCLEAGANDYLSKPVRLKELTELIKGFCN
jgi:CheY-like chemotaxis protein